MMLKKNVGNIDRGLRILLGLALLAAFFMFPDASWRYFALIGIVPLATGLMSSCPVYSIIGVNTCSAKKS